MASPRRAYVPLQLHESPVVVAVSIAGDSPRIVTVDARRHIGVHRWCLRATATPHYESTCDPERLELDTRLAQAGAFVQQLAPLFAPAPWATGRLAPPGPANRGEAVGQALAPAVPRSAGGKRGKSPGQDLRQDSALPLATGGVHGERWLSSELVAFSSDGGHMVLAGQWDSAARVICLLGGCPVTCTVQGHADTVTAVAVAPVPSPCAEVGAVASLNRQVSGRPLAVHLPLSVKGEAGVVVAGPSSQGAVTAGGVMDASAIARSMLSLCEQADRAGGAALVAETASDRAGSLSELAAKVVAASACAAGPADPALLAAASRVLRAAGSSASGGALARSDRGIAARASIGEGVLESTAASVGSVVTKAVSGGAADGSDSGGAFGSGKMSDAVSHSAMAAARAYGLLDSVRSPVSGSRTEGLAGGSAAVLDYLVTASADASVRVWLMHGGLVSRQPMYILHGHDAPVTSVAADSSLDVLLSGSDDGTVIVRQLSSGRYVRTIEPLAAELAAIAEWRRCRHNLRMSRLAEAQRREELARREEVAAGDSVVVDVSEPMAAGEAEDAATYESMRERAIAQHSRAGPSPVEWVGVSSAGIVVLRIGDKLLRSFSLDGRQLCRSPLMLGTTPHALLFSEDGRYLLVAGGSPYIIIVLDAESLEPVQYIGSDRNRLGVAVTDVQLDPAIASSGGHLSGADYRRAIPKLPEDVDPFHVPVTSLAFSRGERHLLVGLASGQLMILKSTQELGQQAVHLAREKLFVN
ncbi:nbeal2 [Symbiodinium sp. KB8]|nr:nbeal2 [Symbiodinium sp. KB8]